jgi:hypothetical protein
MALERIKVTFRLDAEVVRAYRIQAARTGRHDHAVVEDALRKYLGIDFLKTLPSLSTARLLDTDEADQIAVQAVRDMRHERSKTKMT